MGRLLLVRHCESTGQAADAPLTEAGVAAALALADRLAALGVDAVYSSPYRRAVATVQPYARAAGLPVHEDARLRERLLSETPQDDWLDHLRRSYDDETYRLPTGESLAEARARGLTALADIDAAGHALAAVASHGNLISGLLRAADGKFGFDDWKALRNPDLFELKMAEGRPVEFVRLD